jgi:hypothetical protein
MGHDAWAILLVVEELKKGHGYQAVSRFFLLGGELDYPPLFFYFLTLFPSSWLKKYHWLINPVLDAANAVILGWVGYHLTGDVRAGALAALIYSFTPVLLQESLMLSTRVFGMILFNISIASFLAYQSTPSVFFIAISVAAGIMVLLSHKFAGEVLFLLLLSFSLIRVSLVPAGAFLAMFVGALVFSGGFYLKVVRGQIGINRFWLRHYRDYGLPYVEGQKAAGNVEASPVVPPEGMPSSPVYLWWRKTKRFNPLNWLLRLNPFNPFSLVVILTPFIGIAGGLEWGYVDWALLTLGFYYAASYLRFLGHYAGRYQFLDYNAFPAAMVCSIFAVKSQSYVGAVVVIVSIAFILALIQNIRTCNNFRRGNRSDDQSLLFNIFAYLRGSPKDGIICLPSSHTYAMPYFAGKKVFYTMSAQNYESIAAFFPVLKVPSELSWTNTTSTSSWLTRGS